MNKVLLIKMEGVGYSSIGMEEAFKASFDEVRSINWQHIKLQNGFGGAKAVWEAVYKELMDFYPDLIFVQIQKGEVLDAAEFKKMSEYGFVINYTEDVKNDTSWHERVAPYCFTIFTNKDDMRRFCDMGLRAAYMLVSYNHLWYKPLMPKTTTDYGEIVFIGNNYVGANVNFPQAQERADMCKFMKEKFGRRFQAYGNGQENQRLEPMQVKEAYNNCKVAITHNNFKRDGYMSDRGLNAMACGAVTIHQHFEDVEEMFKDFQFLLTWKTFDDLAKTCEVALGDIIFTTAWVWIRHNKNTQVDYTKENHSWYNRIKFIKALIAIDKNPEKYLSIMPPDNFNNMKITST